MVWMGVIKDEEMDLMGLDVLDLDVRVIRYHEMEEVG